MNSSISPMRNGPYIPTVSPQRTQTSGSYSKQQSYLGNSYIQTTPLRNTNQFMATPSTAAQTGYAHSSAPSRFNIALDQVCLLGQEMDVMRKNFEIVSSELQQWKEKCGLIKAMAQTPPVGTNYSPTRVNKLKSDVQSQFQNYQYEINKLNQMIQNVTDELQNSSDKIRSLERKVEEMNKIEIEMLQAKKQTLELDNRNRYQALELNDLKNKINSTSNYNEELERQLGIIPHLKETISVLEEENQKMTIIIQQKDDQLSKQDQKHMQIMRMYQDNLEKTNSLAGQLRETLNENDDINSEIDKVHNVSESLKEVNIQHSIYLSKAQKQKSQQAQDNQEEQFEIKDLKSSFNQKSENMKRSQVSQNRSARNTTKLSQVQSTLMDLQSNIEQLQNQLKDRDQRLNFGEREKTQFLQQIESLSNEIAEIKNFNIQQSIQHEENIKRQKREYSDNISNQLVPLQKENEQLHLEIESLQNELSDTKVAADHLQVGKQILEEQMTKERQQSYNASQKMTKEYEMKCDALTERLIQKEGEISNEMMKNKELFEDNRLMAEEMRILKQKAVELELWKNKYRELKKETKALRIQFEEYKANFIREIQNRFAIGCDQFEACLKFIDDRFDSNRNVQSTYNQESSSQANNQYFVSPAKVPQSYGNDEMFKRQEQRQASPTQEVLKSMKQTPNKSSVISLRSANGQSDYKVQQSSVSQNYSISENQQDARKLSAASFGNFQDKADIMSNQASKYQQDIIHTNEELDNKVEELVILKTKYEEALNRVHSNINATPKK